MCKKRFLDSHESLVSCVWPAPCVVRHLGELVQENYGRPGLSHIFVAGANDDGMKEVIISSLSFCSLPVSSLGFVEEQSVKLE
jgi:hypothetical protein